MITIAQMKLYEGEDNPRNKDCITIKRTEYLHLLETKKKLMLENNDIKLIKRDLDQQALDLKKKEKAIEAEKFKISLRIKQFSSDILKQVEDI